MSKQILYLSLLISTCLFVNISCSSKNIKPLTELEIVQRLLEEQKINGTNAVILPVKINISQPGKAITDKPLELQLEIAANKALPYISVIIQPKDGLSLKPHWLFFDQISHTFTIKNIIVDQLYRRTLTVIPKQKGLLALDIYTITEIDNIKKAKLQTMYFSIGNPLKEKSTAKITVQ